MTNVNPTTGVSVDDGKPPSRIAFGSCNSLYYEQLLWPAIQSRNAAAFVWGGDAVYGDTKTYDGWKKIFHKATPESLQEQYRRQLEIPGYASLVESDMVVLGTFDDHDYGINNGDRTFEYAKESGQAFLDFINKSSPSTNFSLPIARANAGKGIYSVKVFDFSRPPGQELLSDEEAGLDPAVPPLSTPLSDRSVAVFLLDCRTNKTPWKKTDRHALDYQGDFFGEEQWAWFEEAMGRSTAKVNIVVQGLQVHANRYMDGNSVEDWSRYPVAQWRLYNTLLQPNVQTPILVSGDVHMSEYLRKDCRRLTDTKSRPMIEITASGMSHSWGTNVCARPDESNVCSSWITQTALQTGMHFAHWNGAWREVLDVSKSQEGAKRRYQYTLDLNFGEFEFDWDREQLTVRILGKGVGDTPLLSQTWDFDTLSGKRHTSSLSDMSDKRTAAAEERLSPRDFEQVYERLAPHGATEQDYYCVPYRGEPSPALQMFGYVAPISLVFIVAVLPFILPIILACVLMRPINKKGALRSH